MIREGERVSAADKDQGIGERSVLQIGIREEERGQYC
jgi:hypothetical protein